MKNKAAILLILFASLLTTACGSRIWSDTKEFANDSYDYVFDTAPTTRSFHDQAEVPLIEINHRAAEELADHINWNELDRESPVYFTTFTNLHNPGDTAIFGKVMTEQIVDGLVQNKIKMTLGDPKSMKGKDMATQEMVVAEPMELLSGNGTMTEDRKAVTVPSLATKEEVLPPPDAKLTGNYVIGDNFIYMHAQIVRLTDDAVVSAHNWTVPITDNIRQFVPNLKKEPGMEPTVKTSFN